jgi:hypothetical protein
MPQLLAAALLWGGLLAAAIAQAMILRSTRRVLRAAVPARPAVEWAFALVPALVLALVLVLSWRAATAPPTVRFEVVPTPAGVRG